MANVYSNFTSLSSIDAALASLESEFLLSDALDISETAYYNAENLEFANQTAYSDSYIAGYLTNNDHLSLTGENLTAFPKTVTQADYYFTYYGVLVTLEGQIQIMNDYSYPIGYLDQVTVSDGYSEVSIEGYLDVNADVFASVSRLYLRSGDISLSVEGNLDEYGAGNVHALAIVAGGYSATISGIDMNIDLLNSIYTASDLAALVMDGSDTVTGSGAGEYLFGFGGADSLQAGNGNDTLDGGAGGDILNGGAGVDTAMYLGSRADYSVTRTATGYTVTDQVGADGTDMLTGVEQLQFADTAMRIPSDRLTQYFIAYYGRAGNPDGVTYWEDVLADPGLMNGDEAQLVWNFGNRVQEEFQLLYGNALTPEDFIGAVFQNLFNRTPDEEGMTYWLDIYDEYRQPTDERPGMDEETVRGKMVTWIMDGAQDATIQGVTYLDRTTLQNKVQAAATFTLAVDTVEENGIYNDASNEASFDYARDWLHGIGSDPTALNAALDPTALDNTLATLVGLAGV